MDSIEIKSRTTILTPINDKGKIFSASLVFCWLLIGVFKIYLNQILLFEQQIILKLLFFALFWLAGLAIIVLALKKGLWRDGAHVDSFILICAIFLFLSLVNYLLLTFVFVMLIWYAIARLIDPETFRFCYLASLLLLLITIMMTVQIGGQTYYYDGRYGQVATFGFANPNSFPQLLIILFLVLSSQLRYSLLLAVVLFILFVGDIRARTFYLILALYPALLLLAKFGLPKIVEKVMFILVAINLLMIWLLNRQWVVDLDKLLSFRLSFCWHLLASMKGLGDYLFGVSTSFAHSLPMDMSCVVVIFQYGVPAVLFLSWCYMKGIGAFFSQKENDKVAFILCFLAYAFVENVLVNYLLNPTLYYVLYGLQKNKQDKNDLWSRRSYDT